MFPYNICFSDIYIVCFHIKYVYIIYIQILYFKARYIQNPKLLSWFLVEFYLLHKPLYARRHASARPYVGTQAPSFTRRGCGIKARRED